MGGRNFCDSLLGLLHDFQDGLMVLGSKNDHKPPKVNADPLHHAVAGPAPTHRVLQSDTSAGVEPL